MNDLAFPHLSAAELHDRAVARDLALLGVPAPNWPAAHRGPNGEPVLDALVVGAGMNGIAAAGALLFKGVRNIAVLDRAAPGREGPWVTTARMETLRSPKTLPGPALGVPSLTFQAWFEARFGVAAWEALYKIANGDWQGYLGWLQCALALPVRHGVALDRIEPAGPFLAAHVVEAGEPRVILARRIVLATGRGGAGGDHWPAVVDPALRPDLAVHANGPIDVARLRGASLAVLGGGASAWDAAATALEGGAARVDMYVRRPFLPQVNKGRGSAFPGFLHGWATLSDAERWSLMVYMDDLQGPVPHETVQRGVRLAGLHVHLAAPVVRTTREGQSVLVWLAGEDAPRRHDALIVGAGYEVDADRVPELRGFAGEIAAWGDFYAPPPDQRRAHLARFPYLGPGFELTAKRPEAADALGRIHLVNYGAHLSHTGIASDIPGVNIAAERVAGAITASLFREDLSTMREKLEAFDEPELESTPFFVPKHLRGAS